MIFGRIFSGLALVYILTTTAIANPGTSSLTDASKSESQSINFDAERLRAARALFDAQHFDAVLDLYGHAVTLNFAQTIAKRGGDTAGINVDKILAIVEPDFASLHDWKLNQYLQAYAKNLTADDMYALVNWVKTPLGQRVTAAQLAIGKDVYSNSMPEMQVMYTGSWLKHMKEFESLGLKFDKR